MNGTNTATLVIDMQLVAFDAKITPPIPDGAALLQRLVPVLHGLRAQRVPIVYLQTCARDGQPYARDMHGWQIHPDIVPNPTDQVFFKVGPSAFENPDLHPHLAGSDITHLIICGIWSEGCVAYTCRSALKLGYQVTLIGDGHSTVRQTTELAAEVVLEQNQLLVREGVQVVSVDALLTC